MPLLQNVRLRSANRGNANNTWNVNSSGNVNNNNASNANRFAPSVTYELIKDMRLPYCAGVFLSQITTNRNPCHYD